MHVLVNLLLQHLDFRKNQILPIIKSLSAFFLHCK